MLIAIPGILSAAEADAMCQRLEAADWQDGARSAGALARAQKHNQQLDETSGLALELGNQVLRKLGHHPLFVSAALPNKIYPPRFNRYADGGSYGTHVDSAVMRPPNAGFALRSDLSATLFLSDADAYEGGELQVEGAFGAQAVKLGAGDLVLYPSSSLHRVAPVTRGTRLASFMWIESLVRDDAARAALFDLDQSIQGLGAKVARDDPHLLRLSGVYHNLLRLWAST